MKKTCALLALCLMLTVPGLARASTFVYDFSGQLTSVSGISGMAGGQSFTGSFTFSKDNLIYANNDPRLVSRVYLSPATLSITAGGQTFTTDLAMKHMPGDTNVGWLYFDDSSSSPSLSHSEFVIQNSASGSILNSKTYAESLDLKMILTSFSDGSMRSSSFMYTYMLSEMLGGAITQEVNRSLSGTVTSFSERATPTPLPAAVWLLGSGLVGLAGLRKKIMKA